MRTAFNPMGVGDMAKDYIIDYGNNSNGYWRKWKSGFIEQWGVCNCVIYNNTTINVNFPIKMSDTNYYATSNPIDYDIGSSWVVASRISNLKTNSMIVRAGVNGTGGFTEKGTWYVCGY